MEDKLSKKHDKRKETKGENIINLDRNILGKRKEAAWEDDDDQKIVVNINNTARLRKLKKTKEEVEITGSEFSSRLENYYNKLYSNNKLYKWADAEREIDLDEKQTAIQTLLQTTHNPLKTKFEDLPPKTIDITKLDNVNLAEPASCVIQNVQFHPEGQILLSSGLDKMLRLYKIGIKSEPICNVFLQDLPIWSSYFLNEGKEILISGYKKHFYSYDIHSLKLSKITHIQGYNQKDLKNMIVSADNKYIFFLTKSGTILVVCGISKTLLFKLEMNGSCLSGAYDSANNLLYTAGGEGIVYIWDLNIRKCIHSFIDTGSISVTHLAISPNNNILAVGSEAGVVNLYKNINHSGFGTLHKSLMNLTTTVTGMKFNSTSEILGTSSKWKHNSLKLTHFPSFSVFSNYPSFKDNLKYVTAFDFSRKSGYLAIGNDEGKIFLSRLNHYSDY